MNKQAGTVLATGPTERSVQVAREMLEFVQEIVPIKFIDVSNSRSPQKYAGLDQSQRTYSACINAARLLPTAFLTHSRAPMWTHMHACRTHACSTHTRLHVHTHTTDARSFAGHKQDPSVLSKTTYADRAWSASKRQTLTAHLCTSA